MFKKQTILKIDLD